MSLRSPETAPLRPAPSSPLDSLGEDE